MAEGKLAQSRYFLKLNELTLKLIKAFSSKTSFISIDDIQSLEELLIAIKQQIQYAYIDQEEFHLYAVVDTWLKDQYGHNDFPNNYPAEIKNILEELITLHKEVLNKDNPSSKLVCGTQIQAVRSQWMDMLDRAIIAEERAEEAMRIAEQAREAERCAKESERLALQRGDQEQQKRLTTEQEVAALFIKYRSNKITKKQYDHAMARLVQSFTCMQEQEPTVQVAEEATTATQATTFGIFGTESANTSKPRESAEAKQEPSEDVEAEMYEKHI